MPFNDYEKSDYRSNRIELYEIGSGLRQSTIHLTNAQQTLMAHHPADAPELTRIYTAVPISRNGIIVDGDTATTSTIDIELGRLPWLFNQLRELPTYCPVVIRAYNIENPDELGILLWKGVYRSLVDDGKVFTLTVDRQLKRTEVQGCHRRISPGRCTNILFEALCRVDKDLWAWYTPILEVVSELCIRVDNTYTVPGAAVGKGNVYAGGTVQFTADTSISVGGVLQVTRTVTSQVDDLIFFDRPVPPSCVADGKFVLMHPGCKLTYAECKNTFNNEENYLGYDNIPQTSGPFEGNSVV